MRNIVSTGFFEQFIIHTSANVVLQLTLNPPLVGNGGYLIYFGRYRHERAMNWYSDKDGAIKNVGSRKATVRMDLQGTQQDVSVFGRDSTKQIAGKSSAFRSGDDHSYPYPPATEAEVQRTDVQRVRDRFSKVDQLVEWFANEYDGRRFETIALNVSWQNDPMLVNPLYLITHVQTHEFHHKGQIVIMAKHLGYSPPADDSLGGL